MITQDNIREQQIISYCGLEDSGSRILHDAVHPLTGDFFEIKSVTKDKGVSTARQVHVKKINKWRSWYWIIAKGPLLESGEMEIRELFLHHPSTLEPFFAETQAKIERSIEEGMEIIEYARKGGYTGDVSKVLKLIETGARKDDPNIPYSLVRTGTVLPIDDASLCREMIYDFVSKYPII